MEKCPICNRKLSQTLFDIFDQKHCPVHGTFTLSEKNNSKNYFIFKSNMNSLGDIVGSIRLFMDEKTKTSLNELGYTDIENIINERVSNLIDVIMECFVTKTKKYMTDYASKYYQKSPLKSIENDYINIVNNNQIQIYENSKYYSIFGIIKDLRDYLDHPDKISMIQRKSNMFIDIKSNYNLNNPLDIFKDPIYIIEDYNKNKDIIFGRNKNKDEIRNKILSSPIRGNLTNTKATIFYEYLIECVINLIKSIDDQINIHK